MQYFHRKINYLFVQLIDTSILECKVVLQIHMILFQSLIFRNTVNKMDFKKFTLMSTNSLVYYCRDIYQKLPKNGIYLT